MSVIPPSPTLSFLLVVFLFFPFLSFFFSFVGDQKWWCWEMVLYNPWHLTADHNELVTTRVYCHKAEQNAL